MTTLLVTIPFRDRGVDPRRTQNLERVLQHWETEHHTSPYVSTDGRANDDQFNRSVAYNRGWRSCTAEVYVFSEADMLVPPLQMAEAIRMARLTPGLVVPFTQYRYLSDEDSARVRDTDVDLDDVTPESTMDHGSSVGAINVVSRRTLELIGQYDERFEGSWYDDIAMNIAFETCAGPTRWVPGPAYHLYHLPGWQGQHLTEADQLATARNKYRLGTYQLSQTPNRIRRLTAGLD